MNKDYGNCWKSLQIVENHQFKKLFEVLIKLHYLEI